MSQATVTPPPIQPSDVPLPGWAHACRHIAQNPWFQNAILGAIIVNAVVIGLETSPALMERHGGFFIALNWVFKIIFVVEIVIRLLAFGTRPGRFFLDGWNVFDFVIVAVSLMPVQGTFATVGRLARLLRVTRLVSLSPELRLIVATMLHSIPSMGHVIILLSLLLYMYGVAGYYLFHAADPQRWGSLALAMLTLFQVLTLEGWSDMQYTIMSQGGAYAWAWVYFASFIVIAVFVVVNLFIAVVINNLDTARKEAEAATWAQRPEGDLLRQLEQVETQLALLRQRLQSRR